MTRRAQRLILIGGVAGLPGIAEALARETGLTAEVGDPWAGMRLSDVCSRMLREPSAAFAVATGLARSPQTRTEGIPIRSLQCSANSPNVVAGIS